MYIISVHKQKAPYGIFKGEKQFVYFPIWGKWFLKANYKFSPLLGREEFSSTLPVLLSGLRIKVDMRQIKRRKSNKI